MSIIPNYLALYNLSQIEADILIVSDLTATTGTIITLNSTTGTITTLNTTTGNITTLNTTTGNITTLNTTTANITTLISNLWRGTSASSNMAIGQSGDSGTLTSYKNFELATGKNITISPTGYLVAETIRGYYFADNISLYTAQLGTISLGNYASTNPLNIFIDTYLASNKNFFVQGTGKITTPNILVSNLTASKMVLTDASKNLISSSYTDTDMAILSLSNVFTGASNTFKNIAMGSTNVLSCNFFNSPDGGTKTMEIGYNMTTANLVIGNSTPASDSGTLTINKHTSCATNKNLTLQGTGKITTPDILVSNLTASKLVLTDGSKNLISSSYTDTDFARLTANNNFSGNNTFSGTTATFNPCIIKCNTYTGLGTNSNLSLGQNGDTGNLTIYKNTYILNDVFIGQFSPAIDKALYLKFHAPLDATDAVYLSLYQTTGSTYIADTHTSGSVYIGNSITPATDTGTLYIQKNTTMATNKNLTLSSTGKLVCNTIESASTGSVVNILGNHLFNTNIGNSSNAGTIDFNQGVQLVSGKNLSLVSGSVLANTLNPYNTGISDQFVVCSSFTTQPIIIGNNQTSGNITIGNTTPASDSGLFTINKNTTSVSGKYIATERLWALSATGTLNIGYNNGETGIISLNRNSEVPVGRTFKTENIQSNTATTAMSIGTTNTTANVSIATGLTTGTLYLGPTASNLAYPQGWINLNTHTFLAANRNLTLDSTSTLYTQNIGPAVASGNINIATSGFVGNVNILYVGSGDFINLNSPVIVPSTEYMACPDYRAPTATTAMYLGYTSTSGSIFVGSSLSSGQIQLSNTSATSPVLINNKAQFTTSISSSWINTGYGNATTPKLFSGAQLVNKYLTDTMWASAPTSEWTCFESDTAGEGSALIQNGDTTCIINPGDQSVLWWLDEDQIASSAAGSTTYAWSGWKISTAGVFTLSSDRRLKRNITPLVEPNILDKLSLLQIVNFKWKPPTAEREYKDGVLRRKYQDIHTGYIAQDVKDVFPDCVERENVDAYWTLKKDDLQQKYNMGIQALITQNKTQQAQIDAQKIIIDDLTTRLARLEQLLIPSV